MIEKRPFRFAELEGGCLVALSHSPNKQGYLVWWDGEKLQRVHRVVWEMHEGFIPEGFEIDHKCGNRACCNPKHLQCITGHQHAVESGRIAANLRYDPQRRIAAQQAWINTPTSGAALGRAFGVDTSTACAWIRGWKVAAA